MDQDKIGKFIAEQRKERKLTQAQLADRLNVTYKAVSKWENGKSMPDLSLFKPLCNELGITINELMSGEKLEKENYQNKLEENMTYLSLNSKYQIRRMKIFGIISLSLILLLGLVLLIYNCYEIDVKYDKNLMKCNFNDNKLIYQNIGVSVLNTDYTTKIIDNKKIYIFHNTINIYNKRRSNYDYGKSLSVYLGDNKIPFGSWYSFDYENELYDNVMVYYTNKSINKIRKMKNYEIRLELDKMELMCQKISD